VIALVGLADQVGQRVLGYPVLGTDAELDALRADYAYALVVVGQIKSPEPRISLFNLVQKSGYKMPVIVSPHAHVSRHASVAAGTVVMHGAVINASAKVGRNCIINSQALIEHDAVIGDHCHIATAAALNSGVYVATGSFVGSNSCVRQGIRIGERCVIGMGQRVLADCTAGTQMPGASVPL
jgi:sugar O-acyltransferase (sialic acid O-acetyltransferase NeuD family)